MPEREEHLFFLAVKVSVADKDVLRIPDALLIELPPFHRKGDGIEHLPQKGDALFQPPRKTAGDRAYRMTNVLVLLCKQRRGDGSILMLSWMPR